MNCEQFRHVNRSDASFLAMTRAERACSMAHYHSCESCRDFISKATPDIDDKSTNAEKVALVLDLASGDFADEEYVRVVEKGE